MPTDKQIEANRQNAQLCTGPKTEEGKARSSQNAFKTGIYSKAELLITESPEALDELIADFHTRFAPATPEERSLVDALIRYEWLSRRYMAADTALWNFSLIENKTPHGKAFMYHAENLSRAGRYFNNVRKGFSTTLKELKALQSERKSEEAERKSEPAESPTPVEAGVPPESRIPSRGREGAVTQPKSNEAVTAKLVSFRQPVESPQGIPQPLAQQDGKTEETPPLAA